MTQAGLVSWAQGVLAAEVSSPLNDVAGAVLGLVQNEAEASARAESAEAIAREERAIAAEGIAAARRGHAELQTRAESAEAKLAEVERERDNWRRLEADATAAASQRVMERDEVREMLARTRKTWTNPDTLAALREKVRRVVEARRAYADALARGSRPAVLTAEEELNAALDALAREG